MKIIFQNEFLKKKEWLDLLRPVSKRWVIVTDNNVKDLFGDLVESQMHQNGFEVQLLAIPSGEENKTRKQKAILEDKMIKKGLGRDSGIIALGGGVITDLAGFLAATYCRGIPFVSVPTTLLAMIDASLGGKVAVNVPYGKNMIGTFYHPEYIFIDSFFLKTLKPHDVLNGLAEMIKYGLIASLPLFEALEKGFSFENYISHSCEIKESIFKKDPFEKGLRRILNFGHTIGHALEIASGYTISHGKAIALGMIGEGFLSFRLNHLSQEAFFRIRKVFQKLGFDLKINDSISLPRIKEAMKLDKKAKLNQPRFVLLENIALPLSFGGSYCCEIEGNLIDESLLWLKKTNHAAHFKS